MERDHRLRIRRRPRPESGTSDLRARLRQALRPASLLPLVVVALVGAVVAVAVAGRTKTQIGPFDTTMRVAPGGSGGTQVRVPPFGRIDLDSHRGPVTLQLQVDQLREDDARAIATDPTAVELDEDELAAEIGAGVDELVRRAVLVAVLGGGAAALVYRRRWTAGLTGAAIGLLLSTSVAGVTASTWNSEALAEPRYRGLLRYAPSAVGDARDVVERINDYQAQLAGLIENVLTLYQGATDVRTFRPDASTTRCSTSAICTSTRRAST